MDFENNTITVSHTLVYYDRGGKDRCGYAINTPKTNAGNRVIPMIEKVKLALLEEKAYQKELGIECVSKIDGYTNFVFVNRFGTTYNQATLNKALRRIIRDCNYEIMDKGNANSIILPNISNHSLRHTFTTRMLEAGVNIKVMQEVLGHSDAQTTMNIYAEAKQDFTKEELDKFARYFE
ncbi:MAG: site-specific integrase [Coprobacillus cateniformis]